MFNAKKLFRELQQAGINVMGCNDSDGRVWDETGDIQNRSDVAAIIAAHDPTPEPEAPSIDEQVRNLQVQLAELLKRIEETK